MNQDYQIMEELINFCKYRITSEYYVEKVNQYLVARIYYKNTRISEGYNQKKSHPFQARFSSNEHAIFLHAETDAIRKALAVLNVSTLPNCVLYVARAKWENEKKKNLIQGMAKPCEGCQKAIATFGIRTVYYTLDNKGYSAL